MLLQFCCGVREAPKSELRDDCCLNIYLRVRWGKEGGGTFKCVGEKKEMGE